MGHKRGAAKIGQRLLALITSFPRPHAGKSAPLQHLFEGDLAAQMPLEEQHLQTALDTDPASELR